MKISLCQKFWHKNLLDEKGITVACVAIAEQTCLQKRSKTEVLYTCMFKPLLVRTPYAVVSLKIRCSNFVNKNNYSFQSWKIISKNSFSKLHLPRVLISSKCSKFVVRVLVMATKQSGKSAISQKCILQFC